MLGPDDDVLSSWLDAEMPGEDFRDALEFDPALRSRVQQSRALRVLVGHALRLELMNRRQTIPASGHINDNELAAFADENLSEERMYLLTRHLVECGKCFEQYIHLHLVIRETTEAQPLTEETLQKYQAMIDRAMQPALPDLPCYGLLNLIGKQGCHWSPENDGMTQHAVEQVSALHYLASRMFDDTADGYRTRRQGPDSFDIQYKNTLLHCRVAVQGGYRLLHVHAYTRQIEEPVSALKLLLQQSTNKSVTVHTDDNGNACLLLPRHDCHLVIDDSLYIRIQVTA